jgi:hypothetical protein
MVSVLRSTEVRLASLELISIDQGKKRGMSNRHCTPDQSAELAAYGKMGTIGIFRRLSGDR